MYSAQASTLHHLFIGGGSFIVPVFQRAYVWDQEQWSDLLYECKSLAPVSEKNLNKSTHFFGVIITR